MLSKNSKKILRHLVIVLGDQLDRQSSAFNGFDSSEDAVWMAEVQEEAEHVWLSKARIVMFLSAMRHFAASLRKEGILLHYRVLMEDDKPLGGKWNFDSQNRQVFSKKGPNISSPAISFLPDEITQEVICLVQKRFQSHPGSLNHFNWPVTPEQASKALMDFVQNRLGYFGAYQDAMWKNHPFLYHSGLSAAMNLKILNPREVINQTEDAYLNYLVPLNSVEGFIRQILGWREFIRGVYWRYMPGYLDMNALGAECDLPEFYWTGETDAHCLKEVIRQTLRYGYAHHIQRLMVTGLFALLLGVRPQEVHQWYLAVYVDAVEWVELPNALGMSQFADGGVLASKPYVATGKYINRMSNYCQDCPYDPNQITGEHACPFTTLYWQFLIRHAGMLSRNPRMALQLRNLERLDKQRIKEINQQVETLKAGFIS